MTIKLPPNLPSTRADLRTLTHKCSTTIQNGTVEIPPNMEGCDIEVTALQRWDIAEPWEVVWRGIWKGEGCWDGIH